MMRLADLEKICKEYYEKICRLEIDKYDVEWQSKIKDMDVINTLIAPLSFFQQKNTDGTDWHFFVISHRSSFSSSLQFFLKKKYCWWFCGNCEWLSWRISWLFVWLPPFTKNSVFQHLLRWRPTNQFGLNSDGVHFILSCGVFSCGARGFSLFSRNFYLFSLIIFLFWT